MAREVMFVGSVPLKPAMSVFRCACDRGLAPLMRRIPDGEQGGWAAPLWERWATHPALEPTGEALPISRRPSFAALFNEPFPLLRLKPEHGAEELVTDDLGIARSLEASYAEFTKAKAEGIVAPGTRFVATMAGPRSGSTQLDVPWPQLFPVLSRMYRSEIARVLKIAPPEELAIQIDLAGEVGLDEYRRRPQDFEAPLAARTYDHWPFDETSSLIAEITNAVPEAVELGFHLCSFYHVDESAGQDLNVFVDWSNALTQKIKRPIDYIHMPTTRDFDVDDFEPLQRLELNPRTKLYLGVIHAEDGVEGLRRRIRAAAQVRPDFGVASFCGLRIVSRATAGNPMPIEQVLDLHREASEAV